jgi:hypothetical protein
MASKRNHRRHACLGKVRYHTLADAQHVLTLLRGPLSAYRCLHCHNFHIGHFYPRPGFSFGTAGRRP